MSVNNENTKKSSSALLVAAKEFTPTYAITSVPVIPASYSPPNPYIDQNNSYQYNYQQQMYGYPPYQQYAYVPYQQPYYNNPRPFSNPAMTTGTKNINNSNNNFNTNSKINNSAIKPKNNNDVKENKNSNDLKHVLESKDNYATNNDTGSVVLGADISRLANESGEINFFADVEIDSSE